MAKFNKGDFVYHTGLKETVLISGVFSQGVYFYQPFGRGDGQDLNKTVRECLLRRERTFSPAISPRAARAKAPQAQTILKHLRTGDTISPMEAIITYGIMRLAPAIHDLRCAGYSITSEIHKDRRGKRFARYQLAA